MDFLSWLVGIQWWFPKLSRLLPQHHLHHHHPHYHHHRGAFFITSTDICPWLGSVPDFVAKRCNLMLTIFMMVGLAWNSSSRAPYLANNTHSSMSDVSSTKSRSIAWHGICVNFTLWNDSIAAVSQSWWAIICYGGNAFSNGQFTIDAVGFLCCISQSNRCPLCAMGPKKYIRRCRVSSLVNVTGFKRNICPSWSPLSPVHSMQQVSFTTKN